MKLDFNYDGATRLKAWWRQVKANFQTIEDEHNALDTALEDEITSREQTDAALSEADTALSNRITSEANTRSSADTALGQRITTETTDRTTADSALGGRIDTETSARETADSAIRQSITNETSARTAADTALSTRVTAVEDKAHTHANKTVLDGITETDIETWNSIKEQVTETQLDAAIAAEKSAREAADTALQANIDAHTDYANEIIYGLLAEIQLLYGLMGVVVYDGGLFTQEYDGDTLDGGAFTDTDLTEFDCGDFEPLTIGTTAGVDGGEY